MRQHQFLSWLSMGTHKICGFGVCFVIYGCLWVIVCMPFAAASKDGGQVGGVAGLELGSVSLRRRWWHSCVFLGGRGEGELGVEGDAATESLRGGAVALGK